MNWLVDHDATTRPIWSLVVVCSVAIFLLVFPADASRDLPDSLSPTLDEPVFSSPDLGWPSPVRPTFPLFSIADKAALCYGYDRPVRLLSLTTGRSPVGHSLFQGLWTDPVTGISYAMARWLDTRNANWLSEDPKGAADSTNLHAFVGWTVHAGRDPLGLCDIENADSCVDPALIRSQREGKPISPIVQPRLSGSRYDTGLPPVMPDSDHAEASEFTLFDRRAIDALQNIAVYEGLNLTYDTGVRIRYNILKNEIPNTRGVHNPQRFQLKMQLRKLSSPQGRAIVDAIQPESEAIRQTGRARTTNPRINRLSVPQGALGTGLTFLGAAMSVHEVASAPEGERTREAVGESGRWVGAIGGGTVSAWGAGALLASFSNPWSATAVTLAGLTGAVISGELAEGAAESGYDIFGDFLEKNISESPQLDDRSRFMLFESHHTVVPNDRNPETAGSRK